MIQLTIAGVFGGGNLLRYYYFIIFESFYTAKKVFMKWEKSTGFGCGMQKFLRKNFSQNGRKLKVFSYEILYKLYVAHAKLAQEDGRRSFLCLFSITKTPVNAVI